MYRLAAASRINVVAMAAATAATADVAAPYRPASSDGAGGGRQ